MPVSSKDVPANGPAADFYRPMGVHGAPHVGDVLEPTVVLALVPPTPRIDLSLEATPASEDLRNALCILAPCGESLINDAVVRLIKSALVKLSSAEVA